MAHIAVGLYRRVRTGPDFRTHEGGTDRRLQSGRALPALSPDQKAEVRKVRDAGRSIPEIAGLFRVSQMDCQASVK